MKGEWCYFKEYFNADICEKILNDGLKIPSKDAELGVGGTIRSDNDLRRSKIRFIQNTDPNFTWLFDDMWKMAIRANNDWFGFHITKLDYIQLAEYDASYGGEYKVHHDVFWINDDPHHHRKLTAVVQLTNPDDYEGGELEICDHTVTNHPNPVEVSAQGTTIFFPSFLEHKANKVTKGKRYSLACWFDGPKWR